MCCDKEWERLPSNYYRLPNRAKMREIYLCHSCAPHILCWIVRAETWFCKWKRCNSDFVAKNAFRSSLSSSHCDSQANVWNTKNLLNINVIESRWTWLTVHRWQHGALSRKLQLSGSSLTSLAKWKPRFRLTHNTFKTGITHYNSLDRFIKRPMLHLVTKFATNASG